MERRECFDSKKRKNDLTSSHSLLSLISQYNVLLLILNVLSTLSTKQLVLETLVLELDRFEASETNFI